MTNGQKTLERIISKAGLGSRSEARSWIHARRVTVNDVVIENPDHWVSFERDLVKIDGKELTPVEKLYILLYKPVGVITSYGDPDGRPTVYDLLEGVGSFVGTVGRLDLESSGILLLSNDTQWAERMTNPEFHVPKTYLVKCATRLSEQDLQRLREGVELNDGLTRPAQVERLRDAESKTFLAITISEGRNRQVRRMIDAIGSRVLKLVRTRFGPLTLDGLSVGKWRKLSGDELKELRALARDGGAALETF